MADSAAAVIGKSVQIRGEVNGSEDLIIDGRVEGTITLKESSLTVGPHANVAANVSARDVVLLGKLSGDIRASGRVELRKGADLAGDIWAQRLSIEENALFRGKVDLAQPLENAAAPASGTNAAAKVSAADAPRFNAAKQK